MKKYPIMQRAERVLTSRADGLRPSYNRADGAGANETIILENADPNVDAGIDRFFMFTVTNNDNAKNANVAIVPANFDTERLVIEDGEIVKTYDNIDALNEAGHMVDGVLSDGTANYTSKFAGKTVNLTCSANDPTKTIKQFLDYIKFNPQRLKHLDIISSQANNWTNNIAVTFCNPFFDNKVQRINMNTFFSRFQYQNDRIGIDFKDNPLEFSDLLLLTYVIPAGATMQFVLTF